MPHKNIQADPSNAEETFTSLVDKNINKWLTSHSKEELNLLAKLLSKAILENISDEKQSEPNKIVRDYIKGAGLAFYCLPRRRRFSSEWHYLLQDWLAVKSDMHQVSSAARRTIAYLKDLKRETSQ